MNNKTIAQKLVEGKKFSITPGMVRLVKGSEIKPATAEPMDENVYDFDVEELEKAVEELISAARSGISLVAAANYPERETKANNGVRVKADALRAVVNKIKKMVPPAPVPSDVSKQVAAEGMDEGAVKAAIEKFVEELIVFLGLPDTDHTWDVVFEFVMEHPFLGMDMAAWAKKYGANLQELL